MRRITSILTAAALLGLSACAHYGDDGRGGYSYEGDDYAGWSGEDDRLDPWLADTREGRLIVAHGFGNSNSAERANIWFRRYADTDDDLRLTDDEIRLALVQASSIRSR